MPAFDTHTILAILGVAVAGGLVGLDRTAYGQFMISQPLVAAPFTGLALGDPVAGLIIGATLELIWLLDMPIGTFVPADSTISAVSATAIAALGSSGGAPLPVIGLSILLTTAIAPLTMKAEGIVRHWNARLAERAESGPGSDAGRRLGRAHLTGLASFFIKSFALYLAVVPAGLAAVFAFQHLPGFVHRALHLFVKLLPFLGAALVARRLSMKTVDRFLLGGFLIAALMTRVFPAPVLIVALLIATGWLLGGVSRAQRS